MAGIPACPECLTALYQGNLVTDCPNCTNWSMDVDSSKLDMPPPDKYPRDPDVLPKSGQLHPFPITYDTLKAAVSLTHEKVVTEQWSRDEAYAYMATQGLRESAATMVYCNAENVRMFNE